MPLVYIATSLPVALLLLPILQISMKSFEPENASIGAVAVLIAILLGIAALGVLIAHRVARRKPS